MDEKTEALRDIFIDATGSDTVTERQEETPGSLAGGDDTVPDARLAGLVATMRERFEFRSGLSDETLVGVLRGFFDGGTDADLAASLGLSEREAFDARMDLHLVTDADRTPVDDAVRRLVVDGADLDDCLEAVDADPGTVRRAYRVVESEMAARRASHRFRDEFADLLSDEDIATRLASDARRDGLEDATEDLETDVSL
ncbi:conditioned medium-induced protein 4 [Salinigranum salinum]|uniref:conditioned medium-induced protein 4 n=1 Tax=Salinigranum salinum TaxID=1364937 RepID=UPI0012604D2D|nr:conditioned medium-induced protein 4 [Salinigranum salinum]